MRKTKSVFESIKYPRNVMIYDSTMLAFAWVRRSKIREFIFLNLNKQCMQKDLVEIIAKGGRKSSSHYTQISRAITELEIQNLIKCSNPDDSMGKLYVLTEKGKRVKKIFESMVK